MIIARSPLRISLGGGGTDLPSYYESYGGLVLSAAIDKYVYVNVMRPFTEGIFLKYSEIEKVKNVDQVSHPIIREVLKTLDITTPQIEITTLADIPAGTGLGSSGSFTTALIKALYLHYRKNILPDEVASLACCVELDRLGQPIGKQDQYIAAIGGITKFDFSKNGSVLYSTLSISNQTLLGLEDNLLLFYTGHPRSASEVLLDQDQKSKSNDIEMIENLHAIKEIGVRTIASLQANDLESFALLMHQHWNLKKKRSESISNKNIEDIYDLALKNGALGGKLVGAGGGGFLMFYANDKIKLRELMMGLNLPEVRFRFDFEGTKVVLAP